MKKAIIYSAFAFFLITTACKNSPAKNENGAAQTFALDTTSLKSGEAFYQCTMDTQVISDKPGSCPVCHMDLTEMTKH